MAGMREKEINSGMNGAEANGVSVAIVSQETEVVNKIDAGPLNYF
jgi:hypothetical protein